MPNIFKGYDQNLWGALFVGAPGQLPTLPSPKSGPGYLPTLKWNK